MSQEPFACRWAALSLSNIASVFLADIIVPRQEHELIQHELSAVSTRGSREHGESWLKEHNIHYSNSISIFQSWEALLEKGDFDVVYISSPHTLHYRMVKKALQCKRNVLVEKPATMNRRQYEHLMELAVQQGVVLMEAMWTRYLPLTRFLRDELLPRIGQVKRVFADFSFPIVSPELPHSSRFLDKQAGAGSLLDQGVYALMWADLALRGSGVGTTETEVVHADTMNVPGVSAEVDDITTVILSQSQGSQRQAVGVITTSMTMPGSSKTSFYHRLQAKRLAPAVRIEGTKGAVAVPFPPIRPEKMNVQWYGEEFVGENGLETEEEITKPVERGWGMWYQADVIATKVMSRRRETNPGRGEVIGGRESLQVLDWMDQARVLAKITYDSEFESV